MNIVDQLKYSIIKPGKYHEMLHQSNGRKVTYIIVLSVIVSIMTTLLPVLAMIAAFGGFHTLFTERIPEFKVEDGKLTALDNFNLEIGGVHFYVDTEYSEVPVKELEGANDLYFTFGSDVYSSVIIQNGTPRKMYSFNIKDFLPDGFDNDSLASIIPVIYIFIIIQFVLSTAVSILRYLLVCLLMSFPASLLLKTAGFNYSRFDTIMLCFYADTLSILLIGINQATGYIIPSFIMSIIGILIMNRYIIRAILPRPDADPER